MYNTNNFINTSLQKEYLILADKCAKIHNFKFRNHCILRIANDNAVGNVWTNVIKKPFLRNATNEQLNKSVDIMVSILNCDLEFVKCLNTISLLYREKI